MPSAINSKKRHYPVGQRHYYVYWLVQGTTNLTSRAEEVARYTAEFELTAEEQAGLASSLAALDARRIHPKPIESKRDSPDPYWSLSGRIKAAWERRVEFEENYDTAEGVKCIEDIVTEVYQEREANRKPLVLPKRQTAVGGSPDKLWWTGPGDSHRSKKITSDNHAVATLRKLDSDDDYSQEAGK